jgi:hypothetical protein
MHDVNWWLMALAFVLGLLLTLLLMIGRVTREVPVTRSVSAGLGVKGPKAPDLPDVSTPDVKLSGAGAGAVAAGAAAVGGAAAKLTGGGKLEEPYGTGSIRLAAGAAAPSGFDIKGNEDSMLYHTIESPWYKQTIAELWFADEDSAKRAGFTRWDADKGEGAKVASLADVPPGPYGKGSAKAGDGGSGPAGWLIKGNADSMLYHPPDSPAYTETIAEVWFFDEETAKAAGFDKWDKNLR